MGENYKSFAEIGLLALVGTTCMGAGIQFFQSDPNRVKTRTTLDPSYSEPWHLVRPVSNAGIG